MDTAEAGWAVADIGDDTIGNCRVSKLINTSGGILPVGVAEGDERYVYVCK